MQQVVVIHGGSAFENYEEYLNDLRAREPSVERILRKDWKTNLNDLLGKNYLVLNPKMPNPDNARYLEWKICFDRLITIFDEETIFIGHSLGGLFLAKYLSENNYPKKIKAIFLISAPSAAWKGDSLVDFKLGNDLTRVEKQCNQIFIYQSRDDEVVPFYNLEDYQKRFPNATLRIFKDRGHFNQENFSEIIDDIKSL